MTEHFSLFKLTLQHKNGGGVKSARVEDMAEEGLPYYDTIRIFSGLLLGLYPKYKHWIFSRQQVVVKTIYRYEIIRFRFSKKNIQ